MVVSVVLNDNNNNNNNNNNNKTYIEPISILLFSLTVLDSLEWLF